MATIRPKTLSFTKGSNTYTLRGLTSAEETKIANALTAHQSINGKADKVASATNNNFAALDSNGNLKDSGSKASDFVPVSSKGSANGVASLDSTGKVPSAQLPSYVDDVLEYSSSAAFPGTGETGKIYIDTATNKTYRWSGSTYTAISSDIALGETSSTAYRGDRGKAAYDHAQAKGSAFASGFYKITTNSEGHVTAVAAVTKNDILALGISESGEPVTYEEATQSAAGLMSASDKTKLDGIASGANAYTHPSHTAQSSGLYKITVDNQGHVTAVTAVAKSDITGLGIPESDTTYSTATTSAAGLMSASDKTKLDGIASGANAYTHPSHTAQSSGLYKITVDNQGHVTAVTAVAKSDITGLGIPESDTTYSSMTGASSSTNGTAGLVPAPLTGDQEKYLRGDGTWQTVSGGGGSGDVSTVTMNGTTIQPVGGDINLGTVITSNPNMTGTDGTNPGTKGLCPAPGASAKTYFLCGDGFWRPILTSSQNTDASATFVTSLSTSETGAIYANRANVRSATEEQSGLVTTSTQSFAGTKTFTGVVKFTNTAAASATTNGAVRISGGLGVAGNIYGAKVYNAVWNDVAECREVETLEPGRCVTETDSGVMVLTEGRLQAGCRITSDTFGFGMGETEKAKTPIAIAGRVLAYPFRDPSSYHLGDAVCSAPNGTIDVMTREEIREYPERIIGTISEIPKYDTWKAGTKEDPVDIPVNGRVWVYVR